MPSKHPNAARQRRAAEARTPRKCKQCLVLFTPDRKNQVYCPDHINPHKAKNSTKTGKSTLEPCTGPQKCGYGPCSTMFEPKRYNHKYCCPRCQDLAELERARTNEEVKERRRQAMREYYQRNKSDIQAKQRETWPQRSERRKAYTAAKAGDGVRSFEKIGPDELVERSIRVLFWRALRNCDWNEAANIIARGGVQIL